MKLLKANIQGNNTHVHEILYISRHYDWYIHPEYIERHGIRIGWY